MPIERGAQLHTLGAAAMKGTFHMYVYRGSEPYIMPEAAPVGGTCGEAVGSYAGYKRHGRRKEKACIDCQEAAAEHGREYRRQVQERAGTFDTSRCGTYAGYCAHIHHATPPCPPCAEARRAYQAEYRHAQKVAA